MSLKIKIKIAAAMAAAVAFGLTGCGVDDVQLNGKIFDAVGFNAPDKPKVPQLAERQPLVVPPGLQSLPEPGSGKMETTGALAEIKDADKTKEASKADLERQQAEYCKVHYEDAMAHGDNNADLATGPLGPCRASVFSAIKKINGASEDETTAQ